MAARRIAKSNINWSAIGERVPSNQDKSFFLFKSKSDKYLRRVLANPETPPKIDWSFYKKRIAIPGLVDNFQKQYEQVKVPYPTDNVTSQIEAQSKQIQVEINDYVKGSKNRISEYQSNVKHLESLLPYEQMTMEDYRDAFPEESLDPINKPSFWPHTKDEQLDYKQDAVKDGGH